MGKIKKPTAAYIRPSEGYFKLAGVEWNGKIHTYNIYEKMTAPMRLEELAEFSMREKEAGNPYCIGAPQFVAICDSAVKSGNANLISLIQSDLREFSIFLSKVIYNPPSLKDKAVHEYGMPDEYFSVGEIVGPDCWIKDIKDKESLKPIAGTSDIKKLNRISQGINHTPMYLWRLNSKPLQKEDVRVVGFDADADRLYLDAGGGPLGECPAFRVLQVD